MTIRLEHIWKSFGTVEVLKDVDLELPERKFITLVGPSGCGKTTLLRILAGLESATRGVIWHGDARVSDLAPGKRDIAMVFQSYALYPHMNVRANMAYGLKVRGTPRAEIDARVLEVARVLEIEHLLGRKPRELSGGQRQRVALGRAMVRKPWLFLMDEPLSNLDAKLRVTMRGELKRLHMRLETTTVYVTHDQLEAMTMSDKIAVMDHGVVQQYATPAEVYNRPANAFVAGFIGSPPMNFLPAMVAGDGAVSLEGAPAFQPAPAPAGLATRRGATVTLGVRPEDLTLREAGAGSALLATLDVREPLGNETLLYWSTPAGPVVSRLTGEPPPAEGARATLHFRPDRLRWFDPGTERALE